jgi:hypothetical protein
MISKSELDRLAERTGCKEELGQQINLEDSVKSTLEQLGFTVNLVTDTSQVLQGVSMVISQSG